MFCAIVNPILAFQLTASRRGWHNLSALLLSRSYFNSQPHEEADQSPGRVPWMPLYFNSQPHEEADECKNKYYTDRTHFNSQPHEEADPVKFSVCRYIIVFQLTASRRGWPDSASLSSRYLYFNSQPHEEADGIVCNCYAVSYISTHSLTKRLTVSSVIVMQFHTFQLTASRRGWLCPSLIPLSFSTFQLTASRRGWHEKAFQNTVKVCISTHSLTKRLTIGLCFLW